jgi:arylsulfatase
MHLFDQGWNKLREQIFENQKRLGVIPKDAKLTPWPKDLLKEWDQLTPNEVAMFNGVEVPVADQLELFYDAWGSDQTYNHMAVPWAWAFDTPFPWTKQIASHLGGIRQGTAISWPREIQDKGGIRHQFHHVIDVVPTILQAAAIAQPKVVDGIPQSPIEGVSMVYTFDKANANAPSTHKTQYFEMMGDRTIYHEGWLASTKVMRPPWDINRCSCGTWWT